MAVIVAVGNQGSVLQETLCGALQNAELSALGIEQGSI